MLITGAGGFIGMNLMKRTDAVPLDLKYGSDVTNASHLKYLYRGGEIIHLAADSGVPQSIENPVPSFRNNTLGTFTVAEFARVSGAKVIFASSAAAEDIKSPYAASKAAGEAYLKAYKEAYGLESCILRLANVYGPYSDHKTSVVANMIRTAKTEGKIYIHNSMA